MNFLIQAGKGLLTGLAGGFLQKGLGKLRTWLSGKAQPAISSMGSSAIDGLRDYAQNMFQQKQQAAFDRAGKFIDYYQQRPMRLQEFDRAGDAYRTWMQKNMGVMKGGGPAMAYGDGDMPMMDDGGGGNGDIQRRVGWQG